jgi:hypothetical protein
MCGGAFDTATGGRYGISIDLGLQVVGKKSSCVTIFKSKLGRYKHGARLNDRLIVTRDTTFFKAPTLEFSRIPPCSLLHAREASAAKRLRSSPFLGISGLNDDPNQITAINYFFS